MKFGIFYEHQLPKPWSEGLEEKLFQDALDQVELADQVELTLVHEILKQTLIKHFAISNFPNK